MPLPRIVARLNKRYTNRLIEPIVARLGGYAVVGHVGRRSGAGYRTPILAFDCDGSLLVALTYGPSADWVQNVLAGGGTIDRDGAELVIETTAVVGRDAAWPYLPLIVRGALRCLRVSDFLLLETAVQDRGERHF